MIAGADKQISTDVGMEDSAALAEFAKKRAATKENPPANAHRPSPAMT